MAGGERGSAGASSAPMAPTCLPLSTGQPRRLPPESLTKLLYVCTGPATWQYDIIVPGPPAKWGVGAVHDGSLASWPAGCGAPHESMGGLYSCVCLCSRQEGEGDGDRELSCAAGRRQNQAVIGHQAATSGGRRHTAPRCSSLGSPRQRRARARAGRSTSPRRHPPGWTPPRRPTAGRPSWRRTPRSPSPWSCWRGCRRAG